MPYVPTQPPGNLDVDGLRKWVEEEFRNVARAITPVDSVIYRVINTPPTYVIEGMTVFADGTNLESRRRAGIVSESGVCMGKAMTAYDVSDGTARLALTQFSVMEVDSFWPELCRQMEFVPHTWKYWTREYIYDSIVSNNIQVWGIRPPPDAVMIMFTTVNTFPAMKVLTIVWAMGRFEDSMVPLVEATMVNFARLNDCKEIEVRGRHGWEPKLKRAGFHREASVWTRPVVSDKLN